MSNFSDFVYPSVSAPVAPPDATLMVQLRQTLRQYCREFNLTPHDGVILDKFWTRLKAEAANTDGVDFQTLVMTEAHHRWLLRRPVLVAANCQPQFRRAVKHSLRHMVLLQGEAVAIPSSPGPLGGGARGSASQRTRKTPRLTSCLSEGPLCGREFIPPAKRVVNGTISPRMLPSRRDAEPEGDVDTSEGEELQGDEDAEGYEGDDQDDDEVRSGEHTGKSVVDDNVDREARCGARWYPDIDGNRWSTIDGEKFGQRLLEMTHAVRMMEKERLLDLFGPGLRMDSEAFMDRLLEVHGRIVSQVGEVEGYYKAVKHLDSVMMLPVVKNPKKRDVFLKAQWTYKAIYEFSLLDFLPGNTDCDASNKDDLTVLFRKQIKEAVENVLLVTEIFYGEPCRGIAEELTTKLGDDSQLRGASNALIFHHINEAFATEFRETRTKKAKSMAPEDRMFGAGAWSGRMSARLREKTSILPTGYGVTAVIVDFNRNIYPNLRWPHKKGGSGQGNHRARRNREDSSSGEDTAGKTGTPRQHKKNKQGRQLVSPLKGDEKHPQQGGGSPPPAKEGLPGRPGATGTGRTETVICPFHLANLLKVKSPIEDKIYACTRTPCNSRHPGTLRECTEKEARDSIATGRAPPPVADKIRAAIDAAAAGTFRSSA